MAEGGEHREKTNPVRTPLLSVSSHSLLLLRFSLGPRRHHRKKVVENKNTQHVVNKPIRAQVGEEKLRKTHTGAPNCRDQVSARPPSLSDICG